MSVERPAGRAARLPVRRSDRSRSPWFRSILLVVVAGLIAALALVPAQAAPGQAPRTQPVAPAAAHTITYDKYSLMIDGQRTMIWSGEFEYWRLPSPSLWLDILQKMKAEGYNAVTIYFDWAYHSPAPGVYDFTGIRDVDRLLTMAEQTGLYVIARPGPYINGETTNGGLPAWLNNVPGKARTNAADYLAASDEWFHQIDAILKNHQLTDGTGSVILYQIENELASTGTGQYAYMQNLYDTARADGIDVPIFHNDKGRNGIWVPAGSGVSGTVQGPNDLYAFDGYPGGTCSSDATPGSPSTAPDWGLWGTGGATGGSSASPNTPGFAAEFGGGWFDYWGSNGTYDCTAVREGPGYERVFYGTNLANGLSIQNFYMTFGGTSWGWEPAPVVYSSYDYGAAISESRQLRAKASTMKELGLFLQSVTPVTHLDKGQLLNPSPTVKVYDDVNTETGTHFYFAMHNPSNATTNDSFTLPISTADGTYSVPMAVNGQDAKILVADYDMDGQHLVYSSSEIMTHFQQGSENLALLYGRDGEAGQTVLRYSSAPTVSVEAGSGSVARSYDPATGDLTLKYTHSGLKVLRITGGGRPALTLMLADTTTADTFWRQDTSAGPVLEQGPELVRTASVDGGTLALTGDTDATTRMKVWAPAGVSALTWNGARSTVTPSSNASPYLKVNLPGPAAVTLPDLTSATWRYSQGTPESEPGFDDSAWTVADHTTTTSTTPPPSGQVVLTADDYGFHQGDVWYRGTYTVPDGGTGPASVTLRYGGGGAGMLQAWEDGVYLGQNVLASGVSAPPTTGAVTFALPAGRQAPGQHEISVMVRTNGHNEDGGVNDAQKEGRGLISAAWTDGTGAPTTPALTWRIQGNTGGEDLVDPTRGVMNVGGQYGERAGWYLPGYPDSTWATASLPASSAAPGTSWYRTTFRLNVAPADDASLGVTIGNPDVVRSGGNYRALIYVNGWNVGQYVANVGPQHTFVVPNGILNTRGVNTIALAVTSAGGPTNALESVALTNLGTVRGGVPVQNVAAPGWSAATYGPATGVGSVTADSVTGTATNPIKGGDSFSVSALVANHARTTAGALTPSLDVPAGWTASKPTWSSGVLAPGAQRTATWQVTVPDDVPAGTTALGVGVAYTQGGAARTTGATYSVTAIPKGLVYVSDLPFVSATNGYGPVERDTNVGGSGSGDGTPITIKGVTYTKGLGTNSISSVVIAIPNGCHTFTSDVGVDDSAGGKGSVVFSVLVDGTTAVTTPTMKGGQAAVHLSVDVTGAAQLTLDVGDAGDGNGHDNGDWAGAQFACTA